jgi:hypothetical protein
VFVGQCSASLTAMTATPRRHSFIHAGTPRDVHSPLMVNVDLMALIGITRGGRTRSPTIRLSRTLLSPVTGEIGGRVQI